MDSPVSFPSAAESEWPSAGSSSATRASSDLVPLDGSSLCDRNVPPPRSSTAESVSDVSDVGSDTRTAGGERGTCRAIARSRAWSLSVTPRIDGRPESSVILSVGFAKPSCPAEAVSQDPSERRGSPSAKLHRERAPAFPGAGRPGVPRRCVPRSRRRWDNTR